MAKGGVGVNISELAKIHAKHTEQYAPKEDRLETLRHFLEHLSKMSGKVGDCVEPVRHGGELNTRQIETEVVPDLLYWALHLCNEFNIDLEKAYQIRIAQAQQRQQPTPE